MSRSPTAWYLGLVALVVIPTAIAVVMIWIATGQQILVNDFYTSQTGGELVTDEEYRYWDGLSRNAYQLQTVVAPTLFTGAAVAIFTLLAVLAFRWERRRQLEAATLADEATASS